MSEEVAGQVQGDAETTEVARVQNRPAVPEGRGVPVAAIGVGAVEGQVEPVQGSPECVCAEVAVSCAAEQLAARPPKPEATRWDKKRGDILQIRFGGKSC